MLRAHRPGTYTNKVRVDVESRQDIVVNLCPAVTPDDDDVIDGELVEGEE
jgi:hypothetical protein